MDTALNKFMEDAKESYIEASKNMNRNPSWVMIHRDRMNDLFLLNTEGHESITTNYLGRLRLYGTTVSFTNEVAEDEVVWMFTAK